METQRYFQSQLSEALLGADSSVTIKTVQYDRGWLSATAVQRVALKTDPSVQFDIHHEINHLPDPEAGWLKVRSTPRWPKQVQAGADYYFGNQPALTLDSVYDFDGHLTTTANSPAFSKPMLKSPETTVSWGGASGTLAFSEGGKMQVKLQAPSVGVSNAGTNVQIANSVLEANWVLQGPETDWHGDSSLSIAKISIASALGKGALSGLRAVVSQRDKGETMQIGYALRIGKGEATGADQAPMAFSNAVLDIEVDRLDKKALAKYMQDLHNAQAAKVSQDAMDRLALQLGMNLMTDLLKGSPVLRIKQLGVQTSAGAIAGNATLGFDGKQLGQPTMPTEWLQRVSFSGAGEISRGLLKSMMQSKVQAQAAMMLSQSGTTANSAQMQQLVERALEDQLKAWSAAGLLHDNGDKLSVKADFSQGKLLVNGQPGDHLMAPLTMAPLRPQPAAIGSLDEDA
jgi:uncharacterized protein YdgA (DUF945 family)